MTAARVKKVNIWVSNPSMLQAAKGLQQARMTGAIRFKKILRRKISSENEYVKNMQHKPKKILSAFETVTGSKPIFINKLITITQRKLV